MCARMCDLGLAGRGITRQNRSVHSAEIRGFSMPGSPALLGVSGRHRGARSERIAVGCARQCVHPV